ncbi:hypothetical protein NBRC110019_20810 [Neptunitalea chrysea]|uniref:Uncharacterized protein n=1 Tax=Neptunitalea chrysea TaxID=1647581 RepID=A0A9W6B593_9FLAO|nr:hypothetical protein [Neptunitalea chrysea]GLB53041.1 hypothetical protein NBRC110019_20810 [Neptunitalea chrysea]
MDSNLQPLFTKYAERLIAYIKEVYVANNIIATGDYGNSLVPELSETGFMIKQAIYGKVIDGGRSAGKRPSIPSIMRWLENKKGLPPSMLRDKRRTAFAIANKIAKEGIKVPNQYNPGNLITNVVNNFLAKDMYDLIGELESYYKGKMKSRMKRAIAP